MIHSHCLPFGLSCSRSTVRPLLLRLSCVLLPCIPSVGGDAAQPLLMLPIGDGRVSEPFFRFGCVFLFLFSLPSSACPKNLG